MENRGIKWTLDRLKRIMASAKEVGVGVGTTDTKGLPSPMVFPSITERISRRPRMSSSRTANENAMLISIHQKGRNSKKNRRLPKRNPFYLSEDEIKHVNNLWINIINEVTLGNIRIKIEERAADIGKYIADRWRYHIDHRMSEEGRTEDVMPGTERKKIKQTGRRGLPPLYRTGMLYRSFDYKIKKLR
jgi:hypothetical protein